MAEAITRLNAALEGRYRIESELGEGGMATVYLAEDIKHERKVALKVLKPELAAVVGAERFLAEIKTTANLQHPHILPLFDSGEADSFLFYVMPYIEGETLRERIDRDKQLPVDEAIGIATAVANALHTAHEQGVVHRDIKPGNILMSRGQPLVADFGIALAVSVGGGGRLTETGLSLGTPYYMSPEQATGDQAVGPASDTFALACVLYEMLVGEPPYPGSTAQAVLGKIIQGLPVSATAIRRSVPANVDASIRKALETLPADRFTGAQDFARALADPAFRHRDEEAAPAPGRFSPRDRALVVLAPLFVLVSALAGWGWLRSPPEPDTAPSPVREQISGIDITRGGGTRFAISRDGSTIAVANPTEGSRYRLLVRRLDQLDFEEVPGTDQGAVGPTFSPDGEWLAFQNTGGIFKVQLSGGPVQKVADGDRSHWGTADTIVFQSDDGLYLVSPSGGAPRPILDSEGEKLAEAFAPFLLPDGKGVLFEGGRNGDGPNGPISLIDLESGVVSDLGVEGVHPQYAASGHVLFGHSSQALLAVPFDLDTKEVTGQPRTVIQGLTVWGGAIHFAVSETGTALYGLYGRGEGGGGGQRLLVVDLEDETEVPVSFDPGVHLFPRWSPDGASVAYHGGVTGGRDDVFTYDVELETARRQLTFEGENGQPVWSPDGTRIAFASDREGTSGTDLFVKTLDDAPPRLILSHRANLTPLDWHSDDLLVFRDGFPNEDLWTVDPTQDSAVATRYLNTDGDLGSLQVSPDGSLAAYDSDETETRASGTREVYVRAFPIARQPFVVSSGGGTYPFWSTDGNTLYYWTLGLASDVKHLLAARIDRGSPMTVTSTDTILTGAYRYDSSDLHPHGDRIVVSKQLSVIQGAEAATQSDEAPRELIVVNWFTELRERMGGN